MRCRPLRELTQTELAHHGIAGHKLRIQPRTVAFSQASIVIAPGSTDSGVSVRGRKVEGMHVHSFRVCARVVAYQSCSPSNSAMPCAAELVPSSPCAFTSQPSCVSWLRPDRNCSSIKDRIVRWSARAWGTIRFRPKPTRSTC